jgi:hypothetical protein
MYPSVLDVPHPPQHVLRALQHGDLTFEGLFHKSHNVAPLLIGDKLRFVGVRGVTKIVKASSAYTR